jgi:hypothetical protein
MQALSASCGLDPGWFQRAVGPAWRAAFLIGNLPGQRERAGELDLGGGGRPEQQAGREWPG